MKWKKKKRMTDEEKNSGTKTIRKWCMVMGEGGFSSY